jgi:putative glutamine amidotransferase
MPVQMDPGNETQYSSRNYPDAIVAAGGLPIMLPLLAEPGVLRPIAECVDGLLLTGHDSDVDPSLFGAARVDACGANQPLRDKTDFLLLEVAMKRRIPILAICFGTQSLNVFLGGTLLQDIPSMIGNSIRHSKLESGEASRHPILISPGSVLEPIAGGVEAIVNSTHHQAIDRPAPGLNVIARAPDGVIESIGGTDHRQWVLGVQWHPEKSVDRDVFSQRLFEIFLARCRAVRGIDEGTHS